jgi:leucyl aminopeptidase
VPLPELIAVVATDASYWSDPRFDALILVGTDFVTGISTIDDYLAGLRALDASVSREVSLHLLSTVCGGRLVLAPTGRVDRDYDDVRRLVSAGNAGVRRARDAGASRLLLLMTGDPPFERAAEATLLGALAGLWAPLQARECRGELAVEPVSKLGLVGTGDSSLLVTVQALERGRRLARDLDDADPERMHPSAFVDCCRSAFADGSVKLRVIEDLAVLARDFPLLMAVARGSLSVPRHHPRVVWLEYAGAGPVERTLLFAGKGVTYDTGGVDLKAAGRMVGMSRDMAGAAAVVGVMRALSDLAPRGVRVIAALGLTRNSIGPDSYVSDEVITGHAGLRVRIGNTDAEGRLILADLLSHLRAEARLAVVPRIMSVATLTGHAALALGQYSVAIENGPARRHDLGQKICDLGEAWGDPFELSRLRAEDYDFIRARSPVEDLVSANALPSTQTVRGHQYPAAFLDVASGLSQHGNGSVLPIPFLHVDLSGSVSEHLDWQHGKPTAAAVVALTMLAMDVPSRQIRVSTDRKKIWQTS